MPESVLHFITNRFNLLEVMSSRLIDCSASYKKYYRDLLELAEGRIPLFSPNSFDEDVLAIVSSEDPQAFPVIVEVPVASLSRRKTDALTAAGKHTIAMPGSRVAGAWAIENAIPLDERTRILFRSDRELNEHTARPYANISKDWKLAVEPDAFVTDEGRAVHTSKWLRSLSGGRHDRRAETGRNRIAGGLALVASVDPKAYGSLTLEAASGTDALPVIASKLLDGVADIVDLERETELFEAVLFALEAEELIVPPASTILDRFEAASCLEPAIGSGTEKDRTLQRSIEVYREILSNDREFNSFPSTSGSPVLRALLLLLLRPTYNRLASLDYKEMNAARDVYALAMFFCGYAVGRRILNSEFRPPELDIKLAEFEAGKVDLTASRSSVRIDRFNALTTVFSYNPTQAEIQNLSGDVVEVRVLGRVSLRHEVREAEVLRADLQELPRVNGPYRTDDDKVGLSESTLERDESSATLTSSVDLAGSASPDSASSSGRSSAEDLHVQRCLDVDLQPAESRNSASQDVLFSEADADSDQSVSTSPASGKSKAVAELDPPAVGVVEVDRVPGDMTQPDASTFMSALQLSQTDPPKVAPAKTDSAKPKRVKAKTRRKARADAKSLDDGTGKSETSKPSIPQDEPTDFAPAKSRRKKKSPLNDQALPLDEPSA